MRHSNPNNDLGTAHGRIVIDFEDRGTVAAATSLTKVEKQFELLNQRLAKIEQSFQKNNTSLSRNSDEYRKASSASSGFVSSLLGVDRVTRLLDKDIVELTQDIIHLNKRFNETRDKYKPLENIYKVLDRYQKNLHPEIPVDALNRALHKLDFNQFANGERKMRSFYMAIDSVGFGLSALKESAWKKLYGHKSAMQSLPVWSRFVYDFSLNLTKLGVAGLAVSKALHAGFLTKFLDTRLFSGIVTKSTAAGLALEKFGALTKRVFGFSMFAGLANKLKESETGLSNFVKDSSHKLSGMSRAFNDWFTPIKESARHLEKFVLGVGLVTSGIQEIGSKFMWVAKIPKPVLTGLAIVVSTVLPAAFQVLAKSLTFTSNTFAGLWVGIKQLSGGLLALPGLIASVGAVGITLRTLLGKSTTDLLKAVLSPDVKKGQKAWQSMPEHLRPLAKALEEANLKFRDMQASIQKVAFRDVEKQISSLADDYLPRFESGMKNVTLSLRGAKDELVGFLQQGQTKQDFSTIFNNTAQTISALKSSLRPVADGFRNIAVVGTQFISELSAGAESLTQKFAAWARVNRENGQMLQWMRGAREGVRDLTVGTKDLVQGLWTVVTMFKTNNGQNFLDRYTASMAKFKQAMDRSAKSGFIFDFTDAVKGFAGGREKIDTFKNVLKTFMEMMGSLGPVVQTISNAFSGIFIPSIQWAIKEFSAFMQVLHSTNMDSIIGTIVGMIASFKLLPSVIGPAFNAIKVFGGAFLALRSTKGVIDAFTTGMVKVAEYVDKIPVIGSKASKSLTNVSDSISGVVEKFAFMVGPITALIAAVAGIAFAMRAASNDFKAFDEQLKTNADHAAEAGRALNKAFLADNGKIGRTVLDQLSTNMTQTMQDLEDTAAKGPGLLDHIGKWLSTPGKITRGGTKESDQTNKWQKEAADADRAAKKLRELRQNNIDLEAVVSSSTDTYDGWIKKLRQSGDGGNEAADVLDRQREIFELYYESMSRLGPAGLQVANGIKKIAEAGGDATARLDGLKTALQGLGFLKVDAMQAAADYTKSLGSLADDVRQAIAESGGDISQAFNKIDGSINTSSQLGANLVAVFGKISNAFMQTANASDGKGIDEAFARLKAELPGIASQLNITAEQLQNMLANSFGIVPEPIKLLLQIEGKQPIAQELADFLAQLSAYATGNKVNVAVHLDSKTAADDFAKAVNKVVGRDLTEANGTDVVLKVGIAPPSAEEIAKLQTVMGAYGIKTGPGAIVAPATMPVAPIPVQNAPVGPAAPIPAPPVQARPTFTPQPYNPQPAQSSPSAYPSVQFAPPTTAAPVAMPQVPADLGPKLDDASKKVDEVSGKMHNLLANPDNKIEINTDKLQEVQTKVDSIGEHLKANHMKADIEVNGDKLDQVSNSAKTITDSVGNLFTVLKDQMTEVVNGIAAKVAEITTGVSTELDNLVGKASTAGSAFVDAFAKGMENNPKAIDAARSLAENVIAQYHQSPPKEGPLSAHGDAAVYAGKQFVRSYAAGLSGALPTASRAAGSVAGAAGSALSGGGNPGGGAGQFLGQLFQLTSFASALNDIFKKISENVLNAMKWISDPKGDGSFFGKMRYQKTVSNEELQKRQNDRLNQAYLQMMAGGQRDNTEFNRRMDIITNAQNAVVDQPGYKSGEAAQTVGAALKAAFPQLADTTIGGARADSLPYHREGRALDVMIPNWSTKEGKELGNRISAWALQNAKKLGVEDTIWQDFWQPANGGQGNFLGRTGQGPTQAHMDHVHITFSPGAQVDLTGLQFTPQEATDYRQQAAIEDKKKALEKLQAQYGPPIEPGSTPSTPATQLQWNDATKTFEMVTPHGTKEIPSLGPLNPETGQPWTDAQRQQYIQQNPMQYTLPDGFTQADMNAVAGNPGEFSQQNAEDILKNLASTNADIAEAMQIRDNPGDFANFDPARVTQILESLDQRITDSKLNDTAGGRIQTGALESLKSSVMDSTGFSQSGNPIDTVASVVSSASGMASDVINTVVAGFEAVGAVKSVTDTLVRGVSSTEDIYKNIDNVQKVFEFIGGIAGSVGSITGLAASITGAAAAGDPSGGTSGAAAALGAVSTIAGFVQSAWEITNALIDLGQEVYRIAGTYVGEFLGYLVGGPNGPLQGNVKFLLDQQANQLLTYAVDNPMDKRTFNIPGTTPNENARNQLIGNINMYGGPGSDPRDMTRQMMFQVNAAQYAGALAQ